MLISDLELWLRSRDLIFGSKIWFAHSPITKIFTADMFDFLAINMEPYVINLDCGVFLN